MGNAVVANDADADADDVNDTGANALEHWLLLLVLRNSRTLKHLKAHELCTIYMVTGKHISSKLSPIPQYIYAHSTHFFKQVSIMDGAYLIQQKKSIFEKP